MKKTKSTITLVLVLAILLLGIGYATLSTNLKINGTVSATADSSNFEVIFTANTPNTETITTEIDETGKIGTFNVSGFKTKGDSAELTYTISNNSEELDANVTATVDLTGATGNLGYFDVESHFVVNNANSNTTTIPAGETAILYVTVSCIKTPVDDVSMSKNGVVSLTATAVEAE